MRQRVTSFSHVETPQPDAVSSHTQDHNNNNKETKFAKIIDFAIPYDSRVNSKEVEKIEKYQDLAREIKKLWGMRVIVIPIVIGTLGTTPKKLKKRLEDIGIETRVTELQKTVILHSARILRKVLEI